MKGVHVDFTLRQLQYFVEVAETGTISLAAERLHVSQSALSSALNELERTLNVQLCVRRKARGVSLTPSGVQVLGMAKQILHDAGELAHAVHGTEDDLVGPLVVGSYGTLAPTVLPRILAHYAQRYPRVALDFSERLAQGLLDGLREGELDIGVAYDHDLPDGFNKVVLYELSPYVSLAAGHRLAQADTVRLEDLRDDPYILLDMPPSTSHTAGVFAHAGLTPPTPRYRTSSFELTRSLVARGFGYALLVQPTKNLRSYEGLPFVIRPLANHPAPVRVVLMWPHSVRLTPRGVAMVEMAQSLDWSSDLTEINII